jgi:site-specific DNA-cytosine methylase
MGPKGFGVPNCEANRHLLGYDWKTQVGDPDLWEPEDVEFVFGNPPCSGFSLLSAKHFRGADSAINHCMWAFESMVERCMPHVQIAAFESVQQAYAEKSGGRELMRQLHAKLERETGYAWGLFHVLHNAASVGGAAIRRRYFWVVSRIPFGIELPDVQRVPDLMDVIGDLEGLGATWERQPYRRPPSWWAADKRSDTYTVDGHAWRVTPAIRRALDLLEGTHWGQKEIISQVARRYYELHGKLPDSWPQANQDKLIASDFLMGYNQLTRWRGDKMARVITGGGLDLVMHPTEDRTITHREVARIQGFPDDWLIKPLRGQAGLHMTWGKGIPVDCGRWIGSWVHRALDGQPGTYSGERAGEREWIIDVTERYRTATSER